MHDDLVMRVMRFIIRYRESFFFVNAQDGGIGRVVWQKKSQSVV
ncbi:hypothetical protein V172_01710 [Citrobacter freundii RLS1]|nr:hypothetical protein V172_01710 [Citrobacter freundii RLS1]